MQKSSRYQIVGHSGEYVKCRGINVAKTIHIHKDVLKPFEVRNGAFVISNPRSWRSGNTRVTLMPYGKVPPVELEDCLACATSGFKAHLELPNVVCPYCWGGGKRIKSP